MGQLFFILCWDNGKNVAVVFDFDLNVTDHHWNLKKSLFFPIDDTDTLIWTV